VSVWVLTRHGGGPRARLAVVRGLATNPLLLACTAGLAWNFLGPPLPRFLEDALLVLGRATLALGLLAMGAALEPLRGQRALGVLAAAALGRLVVEGIFTRNYPLVQSRSSRSASPGSRASTGSPWAWWRSARPCRPRAPPTSWPGPSVVMPSSPPPSRRSPPCSRS